jgi:hypothetical protein
MKMIGKKPLNGYELLSNLLYIFNQHFIDKIMTRFQPFFSKSETEFYNG